MTKFERDRTRTPIGPGRTFAIENARPIAESFVELIRESCRRVEICGSIRRGELSVKDAEIVCESKVGKSASSMFDDDDLLACRLESLLNSPGSGVSLDTRTPRNGPKYKRLLFAPNNKGRAIPIDLFIVSPPAQFGVIQLIRTGPADFSRLFVSRVYPGAMPEGHRVKDGRIVAHGASIYTPDEASVFETCGIGFIEPEQRNETTLAAAVAKRNSRKPGRLFE